MTEEKKNHDNFFEEYDPDKQYNNDEVQLPKTDSNDTLSNVNNDNLQARESEHSLDSSQPTVSEPNTNNLQQAVNEPINNHSTQQAVNRPVNQPTFTANAQGTAKPEANGIAIAAFVLGIIGVVLNLIPFLPYIIGILAVVFGFMGIGKQHQKGFAIAGIVLGALTLLMKIAFWVFLIILGMMDSGYY